mgnify:CR=1 FL=1
MVEFRTNLRELRSENKLTQEELADIIGVSRDSVKRLEGNKYKIPPYPTIYEIARYFDKHVEEIFWYEEV